MPDDTEFTHSLLDNTALSSWSPDTLQAVAEPDEVDEADTDDADQDVGTCLPAADTVVRGSNFDLTGDRALARGWPARARDNIAAITLSKALEQSGRAPTADEQAQLLRFIGFGASELAQNCFRRPGEDEFRSGWQEIGTALEAAVTPEEYAALQRATQLLTTRRRQSSVDSGEPPSDWAFAGAACWNPAWAPACSSRCCLPRCAKPASLPASNTTRSPPASRASCIPKRGCGARTMREANWQAVSTSRSAIRLMLRPNLCCR